MRDSSSKYMSKTFHCQCGNEMNVWYYAIGSYKVKVMCKCNRKYDFEFMDGLLFSIIKRD